MNDITQAAQAKVKSIMLSPIVGAFYRPPAKTIMSLLSPGHELLLDPEPDNPHDPNAIKVNVKLKSIEIQEHEFEDIENELMRYGATWDSLGKDQFGQELEDPIFHLGYIPRSGAKTAKIDGEPSIGNLQVLGVIKQPNWKATLTFSPMGQPICQIVVRDYIPS